MVTVLRQIGARVPSSDVGDSHLKSQMSQAGYRSENAAPVFFGMRIVMVVIMLSVCLLFDTKLPDNQMLKVLFVLMGSMLGWRLPKMFPG